MTDRIVTVVHGEIEIVPLEVRPAEILLETGDELIEIQYFGDTAVEVTLVGLGPAGPRGKDGVVTQELQLLHDEALAAKGEAVSAKNDAKAALADTTAVINTGVAEMQSLVNEAEVYSDLVAEGANTASLLLQETTVQAANAKSEAQTAKTQAGLGKNHLDATAAIRAHLDQLKIDVTDLADAKIAGLQQLAQTATADLEDLSTSVEASLSGLAKAETIAFEGVVTSRTSTFEDLSNSKSSALSTLAGTKVTEIENLAAAKSTSLSNLAAAQTEAFESLVSTKTASLTSKAAELNTELADNAATAEGVLEAIATRVAADEALSKQHLAGAVAAKDASAASATTATDAKNATSQLKIDVTALKTSVETSATNVGVIASRVEGLRDETALHAADALAAKNAIDFSAYPTKANNGSDFIDPNSVRVNIGAAPRVHQHEMTDINGLPGALAAKATLAEATTAAKGLMSPGDKQKLDGIAAQATKNASDAQLRDRSTHTGVQGLETVFGLIDALDGKATPADIQAAIANVIGAAPEALDTVYELADALGGDPNFATTVMTAIGTKLNSSAVSAFMLSLLDDGNALTARGTLGLGALAVLASVATANIDNDAVTNAKLANMPANTLKGAIAAGDPQDLTAAQVISLLGLGSAATASASAFATAAQGAKADSAVQPAALDAKVTADWINAAGLASDQADYPYMRQTSTDALVRLATFNQIEAMRAALEGALNSKQPSLGFTPLNRASDLSDIANPGAARTNLGIGSMATRNVSWGTAAPSGGNNGDIYFQFTS